MLWCWHTFLHWDLLLLFLTYHQALIIHRCWLKLSQQLTYLQQLTNLCQHIGAPGIHRRYITMSIGVQVIQNIIILVLHKPAKLPIGAVLCNTYFFQRSYYSPPNRSNIVSVSLLKFKYKKLSWCTPSCPMSPWLTVFQLSNSYCLDFILQSILKRYTKNPKNWTLLQKLDMKWNQSLYVAYREIEKI